MNIKSKLCIYIMCFGLSIATTAQSAIFNATANFALADNQITKGGNVFDDAWKSGNINFVLNDAAGNAVQAGGGAAAGDFIQLNIKFDKTLKIQDTLIGDSEGIRFNLAGAGFVGDGTLPAGDNGKHKLDYRWFFLASTVNFQSLNWTAVLGDVCTGTLFSATGRGINDCQHKALPDATATTLIDLTNGAFGTDGIFLALRVPTTLDNNTLYNPNKIAFEVQADNIEIVKNLAAIPIPAAIWMFCSGLLGLIGTARLKRHTARHIGAGPI